MPLALLTIPDWLPWLLMAGGGAVVVAVVVWLAVTARRSSHPPDSPAARFARAKERAAAQHAPPKLQGAASGLTAREAMVEVKEIADAVAMELDEKAARLERLVKVADERIEELQRLASRAPARDVPATSRSHAAARSPEVVPGADDTSDADPMTARVIALAEQGLSTVQIAQRTGQGIGTVELILALRR